MASSPPFTSPVVTEPDDRATESEAKETLDQFIESMIKSPKNPRPIRRWFEAPPTGPKSPV